MRHSDRCPHTTRQLGLVGESQESPSRGCHIATLSRDEEGLGQPGCVTQGPRASGLLLSEESSEQLSLLPVCPRQVFPLLPHDSSSRGLSLAAQVSIIFTGSSEQSGEG